MNIIKGNKQQLQQGVLDSILKKYDHAMYCIYDKPYVVIGVEETPDMEYIKQNNIEIFDIPTLGGTIVVNNGDIGFGLATTNQNKAYAFMDIAKANIISLITSKGHTVTIDQNDILINGFKVASSCLQDVYKNGEMFFTVIQCSVNVNLDLIKHICTKQMVKIPKGLSDFNITTEEIEQEVVLKTVETYNNLYEIN